MAGEEETALVDDQIIRAEERRHAMTRPAPLTKECNTCGRILPISDFYKEKAAKDGFRNCCKHCYIEKQSVKRAKDPDHKVKHRTKVHPVKLTAEQREKKREYFRRYREANREKLNQYSRESNRRRRAGEEKRNRGPQKGVTLTKQPFTVPRPSTNPSGKRKPVKVERSCTMCANYPCFEGIENLESDFAKEGCKGFQKRETKKQ